MENRLLVRTQQHEVGNRSFNVEVYKGTAFVKGSSKYDGRLYEKVVETKSFSIIVRETITETNGNQSFDTEWFMDCTARGGEFDLALELMKDCKSLNEIRFLMVGLKERFSVAIHKDAAKLVKKHYKLYKQSSEDSSYRTRPYSQSWF